VIPVGSTTCVGSIDRATSETRNQPRAGKYLPYLFVLPISVNIDPDKLPNESHISEEHKMLGNDLADAVMSMVTVVFVDV
jgi:hypothetical protein